MPTVLEGATLTLRSWQPGHRRTTGFRAYRYGLGFIRVDSELPAANSLRSPVVVSMGRVIILVLFYKNIEGTAAALLSIQITGKPSYVPWHNNPAERLAIAHLHSSQA